MNSDWYNKSGNPLSSLDWLTEHHLAKFDERSAFIKKHLNCSSKIITDLGCGPGLWLDLLNDLLPENNKLIGIDLDKSSVEYASENARKWSREVELITMSIENNINLIPFSDTFLLFNIFPYLNDPLVFLKQLKTRLKKGGKIIIRQYDGSLLKFGPLKSDIRLKIENSLYASVGASKQFKHYELDSVYEAIQLANYENKQIYFETFQKIHPYTLSVMNYMVNTLEWTHSYLDETSSKHLRKWQENKFPEKTYFFEVDLVSILS